MPHDGRQDAAPNASAAAPLSFLHAEPGLRASDAEREVVAEELRLQALAGTLDSEELEERLGVAYGARHRADLSTLLADLPLLDAPPAGPVAPARLPAPVPERPVLAWHGHGPAHRRDPGADLRAEAVALAAVAVLTILIWAVTGAGYFWPFWAVVPWGVLLGARAAGRALGRGGESPA